MERAMDIETELEPGAPQEVKIPRPIAGGSYSVESMGLLLDRLLGHERAVREAAEHLEPLLARSGDVSEEPEPAQIPEPLPGGTEPITRGDEPPTERR